MNKYAFPLAALLFAACNSGEETTTTQIQEPVATILEYTRHRASSSTARWPGSTMWHRRQTPCAMPPTASPRTTGFRSAAGEAASWRPSRNPCPTRADTTSTSKATSSTRRPNRASCGCRRTPTGTERPTIRGTNCGAANTTTPKRSAATRSPIPAPRRRTPR